MANISIILFTSCCKNTIIRAFSESKAFAGKQEYQRADARPVSRHGKEADSGMKSHKKFVTLWVLLIVVLFAGSLLTASPGKAETIQVTMRDAVLHGENQISLLGWKSVNPGLISAMTVSAILLIAAACIRVFVIPRFKMVPGRFSCCWSRR